MAQNNSQIHAVLHQLWVLYDESSRKFFIFKNLVEKEVNFFY